MTTPTSTTGTGTRRRTRTDESGSAGTLNEVYGPAAAMTARKRSTAAAPWPWAATRATRRGSGCSIRPPRAYGPLAGLEKCAAQPAPPLRPLRGLHGGRPGLDHRRRHRLRPGPGRELCDRRRARGGGHLRPARWRSKATRASGCGWAMARSRCAGRSTERDPLVRNTGQPQFSGTALTAARPRLAQRFRSGGGVRELRAIGIKFHTISQSRDGCRRTTEGHAARRRGRQSGSDAALHVERPGRLRRHGPADLRRARRNRRARRLPRPRERRPTTTWSWSG